MFNTPTRATPRRGLRARDSVSRASLFSGSVAGDREPARSSRLGSVRERETASPASVAESAATTVQTSHTVRAARQPTTQEEWDTRSTWSRDERHSVNAAGALPFEVNELLAGADFIVNSVSGHVDPVSGFALVASPSRCVAWNYAKRTHGSPTVYSFEAPYPSRRTGANTSLAAVPPALSSFVGSGSEPGLILVSATGEIRFWDSVTHGLSEPAYQRYTAHQLALGEDFAERLWKLDDTTFVLTTTASTAWGISISNIGGRLVPTAAPFTRNSGIFSRNNIAIFNNTAERGGIVAVAPAPGGVYLLGRSTLQKWIIGPDGGARLVQEFDLRESIGSGLFDDARTWQSGNVHLELNDLVAIG
jgi:nuclear pore complex protein Nup133